MERKKKGKTLIVIWYGKKIKEEH